MWGSISSIASQVKDITKDAIKESRHVLRDSSRDVQGYVWRDGTEGDEADEQSSDLRTIERLKLLTQSQLEQMTEMEVEILRLQNQLEQERKNEREDQPLQKALLLKDSEIADLKRQLQSSRSMGNTKVAKPSSFGGNPVHEEEDDIWATVGLQSSRGVSPSSVNQVKTSRNDSEIEKLKQQIADDANMIADLKKQVSSQSQDVLRKENSQWTEVSIESTSTSTGGLSEFYAALKKGLLEVQKDLELLQKSENVWKELKSLPFSTRPEYSIIPSLLSGNIINGGDELLSTTSTVISYASHLAMKTAATVIQPRLDNFESDVLGWKTKAEEAQRLLQDIKDSNGRDMISLRKEVEDQKAILEQLAKSIPMPNGPPPSGDFSNLPSTLSSAFSRIEEEKSKTEGELRLLQSRYESQVQSILLRERELQEAHFYQIEQEAQKYQQKINDLQSQLMSSGDDEHHHLLEENRQLRNQIKQLQTDLQSQANQVAVKMTQIDRTVAEATLSNNQMKARIIELESQTAQPQNGEDIDSLRMQLNAMKSSYDELVLSMHEVEKRQKEIVDQLQADYEFRIKALEAEHASTLSRLSVEKQYGEEKLKQDFLVQIQVQAQTQTQTQAIEKQHLESNDTSVLVMVDEKEVTQLKDNVRILEAQVSNMASLVQKHELDAQKSSDLLASRTQELEKQLTDLAQQISALEKEKSALQVLAADLSNKTHVLESEIVSIFTKVKDDLGTLSGDLRSACPESQDWRLFLSHLMSIITNLYQNHSIVKASEEKLMKEIGWFLSEFKSRFNQSGSTFSNERSRVLGNLQTVLSYIGGRESLLQKLRDDFEQTKTASDNLQAERVKLVEQLKVSDKDSQDIIKTLQGELDLLKKQYQKDITDLADARKSRHRLDEDNKELKQKVADYEKRLGQLHGKEDLEERLQTENIRLRTELSQLHDSNAVLSRKVSDLTHALDKAKDTLATQEKELERLRTHLLEMQEQTTTDELAREELILSLRQEVMYENERYESLAREVQKNTTHLSQQNSTMKEELRIMTEDLNTSRMALRNLETVLEQFQEEAESRLNQETEPLRHRISELENIHERDSKELGNLVAMAQRTSELQATLSRLEYSMEERTEELRISRLEATNLKAALESSLSQMTRRSDADENTLDRRMVARLLISYFENHSRRQEVLELMARILGLSEEEKAKVGLRKTQGGWFSFLQGTPPDPSLQGQSLSDLWLEFLEKEAEAAKRET